MFFTGWAAGRRLVLGMNWFSTDFPLRRYLIIDIETAPLVPQFADLTPNWQAMWEEKMAFQLPGIPPEQSYQQRAGVMAEFSRVVCIGLGYYSQEVPHQKFHQVSFSDTNEARLLEKFCTWLAKRQQRYPGWIWCGHHIREFDLPFLCRRLLANRMQIPESLDFQMSKPWEMRLADTFQGWRFGDYKHFVSLRLLAAVLGLPPAKTNLAGHQVAAVFQEPGGLERIAEYCAEDVATVARILLRFRGE